MSDFSRVLRDLSSHRSSVVHTFNSLSSLPSSSSPSAVFQLYKSAFTQSAEEMKLASEAIEIIKKSLKRRRDPYNTQPQGQGNDYSYESNYALNGSTTASGTNNNANIAASKKSKPKSAVEKGQVFNHEGIILKENTPVAALVDWHSNPPLWIQATIVNYRAGPRPKYTVLDNDAQSGEHSKVYQLDPYKIIPLPTLQDVPLAKRREFKPGERVLAVYPVDGVTTLYPATVVDPSASSAQNRKKRDKSRSEVYYVEFDDDNEEVREVRVEKICVMPDIDFSEE